MANNETYKILEHHLGPNSIATIGDGIFRCHKDYKDSPYQIIYVDCSDKWIDKNFDSKKLEDYQEKILLKDYYSQLGPVQWNFYYAFISNKAIIDKNETQKNIIEKDDLYSRKLVLSNEELNDWLTRVKTLSKPSEVKLEKDLSSVWIKELKAAQLDAVFSDIAYTTGVQNYLDGKPDIIKTSSDSNNSKPKNEVSSFINKLNIEKYRSQPTDTFDFGRVNLITGINGSGKTSLLEAIELILCGKTQRNPDVDTSKIKISALFEGQKKFTEFSPNNARLYKERDKSWYNVEEKLNRLYKRFNKYNFFNTDAAFQLASDSDTDSIKRAFEDIALGEEVNRIETRIAGFYERFNTSYKSCSKVKQTSLDSIAREEKLISQLGKLDTNPEDFLKDFQSEIKKIHWSIPIPDKSMSPFEKKIIEAKHIVTSIKKSTEWLGSPSYNIVTTVLKEFNGHYKEIKVLENKVKANENLIESSTLEIEEEIEVKKIYDELEYYYDEPQIKALPGLDEKIKKAKSTYDFNKKIGRFASEIQLKEFEPVDSNFKLSEILSDLEKKYKTKEDYINNLVQKKDKLEKGFSQMERIVQEIKVKGLEYLKLNPESGECPLCHTAYPKPQLAERLNKTKEVMASSGVLGDLMTEINSEIKKLKVEESNRKIIEKLKSLAFSVWGEIGYGKKYSFIVNYISKLPNLIENSFSSYNDLGEFKEYFLKKNLVEENFNNLIEALDYHEIEIKNKTDFQKKRKTNQERINTLTKQNRSLKQEISELKTKNGKIYDVCKIETKNQRLGLETKIEQLTDAKNMFGELGQYMQVIADDKISIYEKNIEKIGIFFQKYKTLKQQKDEYEVRIKTSTKNIKDSEIQLKANEIVLKRAKKAADTLNNIQSKHSKSDALQEFIDNNKKEISEIFTVIHSPREFESLEFFDDNKNSIVLTRTNEKGESSISEISTGQRAALALSIFSTLNRKLENGPSILLFDDPVANIDDLNVLLYFDYLREVAINGKRQIFFATANENVAFLFSQKFDFLGKDQFKTIELKSKY